MDLNAKFDGQWEQIDVVVLDEHHYVRVDVGATQLALEAVNLDGEIIDRFTIRAEPRSGGPPDPP